MFSLSCILLYLEYYSLFALRQLEIRTVIFQLSDRYVDSKINLATEFRGLL